MNNKSQIKALDRIKYIKALEDVIKNDLIQLNDYLKELLEIFQHNEIFIAPVVLYKEFMTVEEVAKLFGVTRSAVYRWIQTGKIDYINPPVKNGKGYLIPKDQFDNRLIEVKHNENK